MYLGYTFISKIINSHDYIIIVICSKVDTAVCLPRDRLIQKCDWRNKYSLSHQYLQSKNSQSLLALWCQIFPLWLSCKSPPFKNKQQQFLVVTSKIFLIFLSYLLFSQVPISRPDKILINAPSHAKLFYLRSTAQIMFTLIMI